MRARRLSSARITVQGACSLWVCGEGLADRLAVGVPVRRPSTSIWLSFHCFSGSRSRSRKRRSCSARPMSSQSLTRMMPSSTSMPFELGQLAEEAVALRRRAEAEHMLDHRRDCTRTGRTARSRRRGQVGDIALEVPLPAPRVRRVRDSATMRAHAGVEVLDEALDRAALAGGVPSFEHHHDAGAGSRTQDAAWPARSGRRRRPSLVVVFVDPVADRDRAGRGCRPCRHPRAPCGFLGGRLGLRKAADCAVEGLLWPSVCHRGTGYVPGAAPRNPRLRPSRQSAPDRFDVVGRGLVDLVDPVAVEQVRVAAPAILRRPRGIVVGEVVDRAR